MQYENAEMMKLMNMMTNAHSYEHDENEARRKLWLCWKQWQWQMMAKCLVKVPLTTMQKLMKNDDMMSMMKVMNMSKTWNYADAEEIADDYAHDEKYENDENNEHDEHDGVMKLRNIMRILKVKKIWTWKIKTHYDNCAH